MRVTATAQRILTLLILAVPFAAVAQEGAPADASGPTIDLTNPVTLPAPSTSPGDVPTDPLTGSEFGDCFVPDAGEEAPTPEDCVPSGPSEGSGTLPGGASERDQGIVDLIEADYDYALNLPWVVGSFLPPIVHVTHEATYLSCRDQVNAEGGMLSDCVDDWSAATPAAPVAQAEAFDRAVDRAWERFEWSMIDDLHDALNSGEPCLTPPRLNCSTMIFGAPPIVPLPNPACIVRKLITAYPIAFAEHYPALWADIFEAAATHLPNTVVYGLTLNPIDPLDGSMVAPIYSPVPDLEEIGMTLENLGLPYTVEELGEDGFAESLTADARRELYYHEPYLALLGIDLNAPVLPGERDAEWPGLIPLEEQKGDLGPSHAMDYEFKGYIPFSQLHTPLETHWFLKQTWDVNLFKPVLEVRCDILPLIRMPGGYPVPVPSRFGIPTVEMITVPEGYKIPRTEGDGLLSLW